MTLPDHVEARIVRGDGCWTWRGCHGPTGYPQTSIAGKTRRAHRVVYEFLVGPIPKGLALDHLCRNRGCVNPDHLEPVTSRINTLRGETLTAENAQKTHCHNGHPLSGANVYTTPGTKWRGCRECRRTASRLYARRKRAA